MASELIVQTIQGPSSGANANKVLIPSGHTLDVSGGTLVPSAGAVVQVVHGTQSGTSSSSTSTNWIDTGLSVSITPTSTSSKILVLSSTIVAAGKSSTGNPARFDLRLVNYNASEIAFDSRYVGTDYQGSGNISSMSSPHGYFSPASTSPQTYKLQARIAAGLSSQASTISLSWYAGGTLTITAMEIAQ